MQEIRHNPIQPMIPIQGLGEKKEVKVEMPRTVYSIPYQVSVVIVNIVGGSDIGYVPYTPRRVGDPLKDPRKTGKSY